MALGAVLPSLTGNCANVNHQGSRACSALVLVCTGSPLAYTLWCVQCVVREGQSGQNVGMASSKRVRVATLQETDTGGT